MRRASSSLALGILLVSSACAKQPHGSEVDGRAAALESYSNASDAVILNQENLVGLGSDNAMSNSMEPSYGSDHEPMASPGSDDNRVIDLAPAPTPLPKKKKPK